MQQTSSHVQSVAEGIHRIRIPVPFGRLGDVNCYLLKDEGGWAVVDTGLNTPDAQAAWTEAFEALGLGFADVTRILLTHSHPDHIGLAGWMQRQTHVAGRIPAPVLLTAREQELATYWSEAADSDTPLEQLFARCGVPERLYTHASADLDRIRQATHPHPEVVETLRFGRRLRIGARRFEVIPTPGHSDGHAALYDAADRRILIGDQVIQHITPTVSRWPSTEPQPLRRYLDSLAQLKTLDVAEALPGHGPVITDWTGRIGAIEQHHDARLRRMEQAATEGATVFDVARTSFDMAALDPGEARFAVAETLSHLDELVRQGRLVRDEGTVWTFSHP